MGTTPNAAEVAKKALDSANNFTADVTKQAGNKTDPFHKAASSPASPKPKPKPATDYGHARSARKEGEFMGVNSDQGPELNTALKQRDDAKKALEQ